MNTVIDFHSHILPGIDDGSKSLRESIAMLRAQAQQGIRCVAATPHFYANHDRPERFLEKRQAAEAMLREEMDRYADMPRLLVGAEVYYFPGMSQSDVLPRLTMGDTGAILVEMPSAPWTEQMYRELADIRSNWGLIPIVAHVDRYISPLRTFGIPRRLEALPVLVQANAEFFLNPLTRGLALRLLREDRIHLLGSDCHNLEDRPPNLGNALQVIRKRLGDNALMQINSWEASIIGNDGNRLKATI